MEGDVSGSHVRGGTGPHMQWAKRDSCSPAKCPTSLDINMEINYQPTAVPEVG